MMVLRSIDGKRPTLSKGVFVDESAIVIGDVRLGEDTSVWPGTVIRADDDYVDIGAGSAVLDLSFLEAPKGRPVVVGADCLISHCARLHGCVLGRSVLVGIGAIVLDGAEIGDESIIAAGSVVPPGMSVPPRTVAMGIPAKSARVVSPTDLNTLRSELDLMVVKARRHSAQK